MKKSLLIVVFAAFTYAVSAQDPMTSKKGTPILPEAGEWAIGADANPFLEYLGNILNGTNDQSSPNWNPVDPYSSSNVVIYGKKVKDATHHYRAKLRLGFGSDKLNYVVQQDSANGAGFTNPQYTTDEVKNSFMNITLGAGCEMRRGKGRLQGYYGPEAWIGLGSSKTTLDRGNSFSTTNTTPTWSDNGTIMNGGTRTTEIKNGSTFEFGIRGFVGVEFFYMAKASIGAEFGWGIGMSSTGEGETTTEYWDGTLNNGAGGVVSRTTPGPGKSGSFGIDTDNLEGSIKALFYF